MANTQKNINLLFAITFRLRIWISKSALSVAEDYSRCHFFLNKTSFGASGLWSHELVKRHQVGLVQRSIGEIVSQKPTPDSNKCG